MVMALALSGLVLMADLPLVVIDAGHGGVHPGAVGVCGTQEKDVTLAVARELGRLLEASGAARVLLTRDTDVHLELEERSALANAAGADLFVSIHANSSQQATSKGVEIYFASGWRSDRRVAATVARENDGRVNSEDAETSPLHTILGELVHQAAHAESQRLALTVQRELAAQLNPGGRGVLQAPFVVLLGARMPAVLVEVGFLTHADECRALADLEHQRSIARALGAALLSHLRHEATFLAHR